MPDSLSADEGCRLRELYYRLKNDATNPPNGRMKCALGARTRDAAAANRPLKGAAAPARAARRPLDLRYIASVTACVTRQKGDE